MCEVKDEVLSFTMGIPSVQQSTDVYKKLVYLNQCVVLLFENSFE